MMIARCIYFCGTETLMGLQFAYLQEKNLDDCNGKLILICIVLSVTVYDLQMTKLQGTTLPCFS